MSHQSDLISEDIHAYLAQHERKELLRFLTCGNVDDGKSTLIGRLLHDSKMIYEDQLEAIKSDSVKSGTTGDEVDLALLVDGLQAEREQGITIDVAYRYFSTAKRKFIIADTPGHEQYTRNMATGASTCDLGVILIDARHGVQTQTKRHTFITSLLGIKHTIVAINKMDLVDYSEDVFNRIREDFNAFSRDLNLNDVHFVPLSALKGDNVVNLSESMDWYTGEPLMQLLENVEIVRDSNEDAFRFPVQFVNRPNLDFRGFCGTIASGIVRPGDSITVLPSGKSSTVKAIVTYDGDLDYAFAPMSVTLTLDDEIDISRGDMIVHSSQVPEPVSQFDANIVWMHENALLPGKEYLIKTGTTTVTGHVTTLRHKIDVNTMERFPGSNLELNEIALCEVTVDRALLMDNYNELPNSGAFILVDRMTNLTVGAGMVQATAERQLDETIVDTNASLITAVERTRRYGQHAAKLYITGGDAETRASVAYNLEKQLFSQGRTVVVVNNQAIDEQSVNAVTNMIVDSGIICICTVGPKQDGHLTLEISENSSSQEPGLQALVNRGLDLLKSAY